MENEEKIQDLKSFLEQHKALGAFLNGVCRRSSSLAKKEDPIHAFCSERTDYTDWTTDCFTWSATYPGRAFWENIHRDWNVFCAMNY